MASAEPMLHHDDIYTTNITLASTVTQSPEPCEKCNGVTDHYKSCPHQPAKCTYSQFGCDYQGCASMVEEHYKSSLVDHMKMLTLRIADMDMINSCLNAKIQLVEQDRDNLISKMKECVRTINSVKDTQKNIQGNLLKHAYEVTQLNGHVSKINIGMIRQQQDFIMLQKEGVRQSDAVAAQSSTRDDFKTSFEKQLRDLNLNVAQMDERIGDLDIASYDGTLTWKITDYEKRKRDARIGKTKHLSSQPFYTDRQGYKMRGHIFLNGDGTGEGTHISLFLVVMRGHYDALLDWPFRCKVTFMLLDQGPHKKHVVHSFTSSAESNSFRRPTSERNIGNGLAEFVSLDDLNNATYVKDNTIFIKLSVEKSPTSIYNEGYWPPMI